MMSQNLQPAAGAESVKVHSPRVRQCSASLWAESPILRNLAPSAIPEINCDEKTWKQLEVVHNRGPFPTDYEDLRKLLAVSVQLQLEHLSRLSLKKLFSTPDYWRWQYPEDTPDEVVLLCFREPLNRLFRTETVYRNEANEILCLSRGPCVEASLNNELNSAIEKFMELELERVPLRFRVASVPMMIMKRRGELKTALNVGESCESFQLFGKYFDLSRVDIDAFHLKYASYLLYKSGETVYFKNLQCEAEAVPYLDNCKFLISKKNNVLVVTEENCEYQIGMWIENEAVGGYLADIYSTTEKIKSVDIGSSDIFLILEEDGSLSAAERGNPGIVISNLGRKYHSAWFHDGALYALSFDYGRLYSAHIEGTDSDDFKIVPRSLLHRFKRISAAQWKEDTDFSEWQSLEEFAKGGRITSIGGGLFRVSENGLELFSTSGCPTLILSSEEYVASSELYLHP